MYGNMSMDEVMKQAKLKSDKMDDELDKMINDDPELKKLQEENLDDLEVDGNSEDELKKLEDEIEKDENPKKADENKEKVVEKKEEVKKVEEKKKEPIKKEDLHPLFLERAFHKHEKYTSMGVINKEKEILEKIVEEKEKEKLDAEFFKQKILLLDAKAVKLQTLVEEGSLSIEQYKVNIKNQLNYEKSMINYLENDFLKDEKNKNSVSMEAYKIAVNRIKERIEIIEEEISQEIPEEEVEEVVEEEKKEDEKQNEEVKMEEKAEEVEKVQEVQKEEKKEEEVKQVQEIKKVVVDERIISIIKQRLANYRNSYSYFIKHSLSSRAEEANRRSNILFTELKKAQKGEEVNEFELPIDITPDFICGYSSDERQKKYYSLIKEISDKKTQLKTNLDELVNKFNGYSKKEIEKHVSSHSFNLFN